MDNIVVGKIESLTQDSSRMTNQDIETGKDKRITILTREVQKLNTVIRRYKNQEKNRRFEAELQEEIDYLQDSLRELEEKRYEKLKPEQVRLNDLFEEDRQSIIDQIYKDVKERKGYRKSKINNNVTQVFKALVNGYNPMDYDELKWIVTSTLRGDYD